jgi:pimeloyl-ACP methyl ester carboxylesterase
MPAVNPYAQLVAATPVREASVSILGSDSHYWDYGPIDAPVTMVTVHGFRGEHHGLEPVIAHLHGVRVINPDLPGFGVSSPMTEAEEDVDGYSKWLGLFIEALKLPEEPVILGHSFGSIVTSAAVAGADPGQPDRGTRLTGTEGIYLLADGFLLPPRRGFTESDGLRASWKLTHYPVCHGPDGDYARPAVA